MDARTLPGHGQIFSDAVEAFYGLGQHQSGLFNYRGSTVELGQNNTDVAIPLLVSSKGYAVMWNTASFTYVDNRFPLELSFASMASDAVDYYVLYGPEMDQIIHEYRSMTGHAPLFPQWAYGLFQSKDRYVSQAEILGIANEYRARHIPLDAIVQDWFWWKPGGEGDPVFNSNYTDVPGELKTLHDEHVHAMISVWGLMDTTSKNYQEIKRQGFEIPGTHVYDPTNQAARDFFWNELAGKLFAQGWDAFWLDSAEPEEYWPHVGDAVLRSKQLHIGTGAEYTNIFPLEHTGGVQEHWKKANPGKRVFLLTRSAFLGSSAMGPRSGRGMCTAPGGVCGTRSPPALILLSQDIRIGQPISEGTQPFAGRPTTRPIRNCMRAGLNLERFVRCSAPMVTGTTTSYGRMTRFIPRCCRSIACATGSCPMSIRWRGR